MSTQKARFDIEGMTCQACASRIEKVLNKKDAIIDANVNFAGEEAQITWDQAVYSTDDILALIDKTGFSAQEKKDGQFTIKTEAFPWRLLTLCLITLPFIIGMAGMLIGRPDWMPSPVWQFALATLVQVYFAIPFYKGAAASLRGGMANMDVLVVLGTVSIWLYSSVLYFLSLNHTHGASLAHADVHAHLYFEASVMVIAFVSIGKYLEQHTKRTSLNSIGDMLNLTPKTAIIQKDGVWTEVPYQDISIGDKVRVRQGERICADGLVVDAEAWADESHLTGESEELHKVMGDSVLAGSLITEGSLVFETQALGKDTLLGDMMTALSEAQGSKAPIARIADTVAAVFVPVVVLISLSTFVLTYLFTQELSLALMHAVAVLVIACPCALGLATPAAIMVGMGLAAKYGVWFRDATALEATAHIDTIVLDKTGTLTEGRPQIAGIWLAKNSPYSEQDLRQITASIEAYSTHPIAKTLVSEAEGQQLPLFKADDIQNSVGQGLSGHIEGVGRVFVGNTAFSHLNLPDNLDTVWSVATIVGVSIDNTPIGAFALADTLREDSRATLEKLKKMGTDIYIMSGDKASVVAHIASELNLAPEKVFAEMSPRDKAHEVSKLKAAGRHVGMVGDGVNDAPALAVADIGFAMHSGSDVAEHTANVTLMRHTLQPVFDALWIAQATLRNIKQNLFFAFFYNILGIPFAALGFLSPTIAGAAMAMSSVSVLLNALRLKKAKAP